MNVLENEDMLYTIFVLAWTVHVAQVRKGLLGMKVIEGFISLTWHQLQSYSDSLTGQMLGSPHKRYGVVSTLLQTSQLCLTHSPSTNLSTVSCVASGVEDGVTSGVSQWRGRSPGEPD